MIHSPLPQGQQWTRELEMVVENGCYTLILRGFDFDGQEALKDSRVLVVGLGGLGCAASQYLASAGVGTLTLLDFDTVSVIPQFFGFITFAIAGVAVCHRHPFDQPEAEQELADGYHIEYSGMKFGTH